MTASANPICRRHGFCSRARRELNALKAISIATRTPTKTNLVPPPGAPKPAWLYLRRHAVHVVQLKIWAEILCPGVLCYSGVGDGAEDSANNGGHYIALSGADIIMRKPSKSRPGNCRAIEIHAHAMQMDAVKYWINADDDSLLEEWYLGLKALSTAPGTGYLWVRNKAGLWRRRWMVLQDDAGQTKSCNLLCYRSPGEYLRQESSKKCLPITKQTEVIPFGGRKNFRFMVTAACEGTSESVSDPEYDLRLCASTQDDFDGWIQAINKVVKSLRSSVSHDVTQHMTNSFNSKGSSAPSPSLTVSPEKSIATNGGSCIDTSRSTESTASAEPSQLVCTPLELSTIQDDDDQQKESGFLEQLRLIAERVDTVTRDMLAEYCSTCDQSKKMLTYFKQSSSEVVNADFSDQVASFLNVISRFLMMLKSSFKEVQDRRQHNLARGLPDLIRAAGNAKVNDLNFAGDKDELTGTHKRNKASKRFAKSKSVAKSTTACTETLSLSGVSGTWKEQLQTKRVAKALILSTAQKCIEKLALQRFVRHIVGMAELRLQTPGRSWGAKVHLLPKPAHQELDSWQNPANLPETGSTSKCTDEAVQLSDKDSKNPNINRNMIRNESAESFISIQSNKEDSKNCNINSNISGNEVTSPPDATSPNQAVKKFQIPRLPTQSKFITSRVNVSVPKPSLKRWGNTTSTRQSHVETSLMSAQEVEPKFLMPTFSINDILSFGHGAKKPDLETSQEGLNHDEDASQYSTCPSSFSDCSQCSTPRNLPDTLLSPPTWPSSSRHEDLEPKPLTPTSSTSDILSSGRGARKTDFTETFQERINHDEDGSQYSTCPSSLSDSSQCSTPRNLPDPLLSPPSWSSSLRHQERKDGMPTHSTCSSSSSKSSQCSGPHDFPDTLRFPSAWSTSMSPQEEPHRDRFESAVAEPQCTRRRRWGTAPGS